MDNIEQMLESVLLENDANAFSQDGELYNYLPSASKVIRKIEARFEEKAIQPIIEVLLSPRSDGPVARLFINALLRLVPTRQYYFERYLDALLPHWKAQLEMSSPQDPYPQEFHEASILAKKHNITYPSRFLDAINRHVKSPFPDVATQALRACQQIGDPSLVSVCKEAMRSEIPTVRNAAILSSARLSSLTPNGETEFYEILAGPHSSHEKSLAFEAFMNVFPSEDKNIDRLWRLIDDPAFRSFFEEEVGMQALFDLPREDLNPFKEALLKKRNFENLGENSLRRVLRARFLSADLRSSLMQALTVNKNFTAPLTRGKFGLLAQRNSSASGGWVGHTGIFINEDTLIHCTVGHDPKAVYEISFGKWKQGLECWGIREDDDHQVDLGRAVNRAKEIASWRTEYDGAHNNQKGRWYKGWFCRPRYWEADCVGFTEHCYEYAGGNPTPNDYESGWGWPLTPREQRDHMRKVFDC